MPNTNILGQSESIRPTILPRISVLFKTRSGYFVQLLSCFVRCVPHTFWHDLPCRRTSWKSLVFPRLVVFPMLLRQILDSNMVVNNIFAHVALSLSAHQVYVIKERCRFSQINFFIEYFHIGPRLCLFPANLILSA